MSKNIRILETPIYLLLIAMGCYEMGAGGIAIFLAIVSAARFYINVITDKELQRLIIDISESSAAADGTDVRENIALQRTKLLWGLE